MTASLVCADAHLAGAEVDALVARCATSLRASGVGEGDTVGLLLRNEPRLLVAVLAARLVGAYAVPVNWHFRAEEAAAIVADSGMRLLLVHASLLEGVRAALPSELVVVVLDDTPALAHDYALPSGPPCHAPPSAAPAPEAPPAGLSARPAPAAVHHWETWLAAVPKPFAPARPRSSMSYTSGTTGQPKGVRREPMSPLHVQRVAEVNRVAFGLEPGARAMVITPLYHSAPGAYALQALAVAEMLVVEPRFDAARCLALIERHRISHLYLVPTLMHRLLKLPAQVRERHDLSSLRFVLHGAAPCPPAVKRGLIEWWGPVVHEFYGGGEAGPVAAIGSADWLRKPGSVGRLVPHARVCIADDQGRELPSGATGTIYVEQRAYPPFTYHGRAELRAACTHPGDPALFTLGDVGHLDEEGFLFLNDRRKDMVISGGVNIYPAEIEAALAAMPGVRDCAVFGVPDEEFGEALLVVVEPDADAQLQASQVQGWLRERLAGYKVPRRVEFRAGLPREDSGKIFKRRLREPYWLAAGRAI